MRRFSRTTIALVEGCMQSLQHCAFNQTSRCLLSLDVEAGDFSSTSLGGWMQKLTPNSGAGLWVVPFRGIPAKDVRVLIDLVYLDEDSELFQLSNPSPRSEERRVGKECRSRWS